MAQFSQKDLIHIKGSEALLETIEKITSRIRDLGCKAETPLHYPFTIEENGELTFDVSVSITLPAYESSGQ